MLESPFLRHLARRCRQSPMQRRAESQSQRDCAPTVPKVSAGTLAECRRCPACADSPISPDRCSWAAPGWKEEVPLSTRVACFPGGALANHQTWAPPGGAAQRCQEPLLWGVCVHPPEKGFHEVVMTRRCFPMPASVKASLSCLIWNRT